MNTNFKLKGVLIDNEKDPRDYNVYSWTGRN